LEINQLFVFGNHSYFLFPLLYIMMAQVVPYEINLLAEDTIVCKGHNLVTCLSCQVDWTQHNQLAASIKPFAELPPPNKPLPSVNAQVDQLKVEGNKAYKALDYTEAIRQYSAAADLAWSRPLWEPLAFQFVREELAPILSNRSAAHVALEQYVEALVDAEIVTRLKADWSKGWFRKGKALFGLSRFEEATKAYRKGLRYGSNSEDLLQALKEAENAMK
jgi:translocation protein SEC72